MTLFNAMRTQDQTFVILFPLLNFGHFSRARLPTFAPSARQRVDGFGGKLRNAVNGHAMSDGRG
jgi:hypothetical protein